MFTPSRLSLARKRRKMTSKGLAELAGISSVTVSRLETGKNEPDESTLAALCAALGFPKQFFLGIEIDELPEKAASFRSMAAMTARERDAALAAGSLAYLFADWVERRFNLPTPNLPELAHERVPSVAARELRQHWGLGEKPIGNVLRLLESQGIRVFSLTEDTRNIDAFSCWRDTVPYVFLNTLKSPEHSRFDAAHELGHLILHRHGGARAGGKSAEAEANSFASSFLMPQADVMATLPLVYALSQLVEAKRRWGVSVAALAYRLHKLEILSDWQYRSFCIQINKRGYRTDEPNGIDREESVVWKTVFGQLWSDQITKAHVAAELWIPLHELENLVFGLLANPSMGRDAAYVSGKPKLRGV
ncbi:MAG: XRE family transcriptional regulator [Chromatiaceae bacterium]